MQHTHIYVNYFSALFSELFKAALASFSSTIVRRTWKWELCLDTQSRRGRWLWDCDEPARGGRSRRQNKVTQHRSEKPGSEWEGGPLCGHTSGAPKPPQGSDPPCRAFGRASVYWSEICRGHYGSKPQCRLCSMAESTLSSLLLHAGTEGRGRPGLLLWQRHPLKSSLPPQVLREDFVFCLLWAKIFKTPTKPSGASWASVTAKSRSFHSSLLQGNGRLFSHSPIKDNLEPVENNLGQLKEHTL